MKEIQGKSILVRVSARLELARVRVIGSRLYISCTSGHLFTCVDGHKSINHPLCANAMIKTTWELSRKTFSAALGC